VQSTECQNAGEVLTVRDFFNVKITFSLKMITASQSWDISSSAVNSLVKERQQTGRVLNMEHPAFEMYCQIFTASLGL
jgi:hypothetical protein